MTNARLCALFAIGPVLLAAACSTSSEPGTGTDVGEATERNAKIVDTISPTATIEGTFDPRVRAYGYVVPVKAGAKITAKLEAKAGTDARRDDANAPLDTTLQVNGPYENKNARGVKIVGSDDEGEKPSAPPVTFTADRDASYLVTFSSLEDTGAGSYKLSLSCEGTDFQCQRANFDRRCTAGQLFVQGAKIEGNVKWDQCEVIILESATVTAGSTLTIQPGVMVKGNYLDPQNQSQFGTVNLIVEGLLQAQGTAANPVAFTSFKADKGAGAPQGLRGRGRGHRRAHQSPRAARGRGSTTRRHPLARCAGRDRERRRRAGSRSEPRAPSRDTAATGKLRAPRVHRAERLHGAPRRRALPAVQHAAQRRGA